MQPNSPQPYAPVILKLLKGVIYSDDQPHWDRLQSYLTPVKEHFSKIGLQVQNYEAEGFAYLEQPDPDPEDRTEPLPRLIDRHKLSFKATVLCILLREQLRQFDTSEATGRLVLSIEKIRDLLEPYLIKGNNEDRFRREVKGLVEKSEELGFLKSLSGQDGNYEVRSILKAKIDADAIELLKQKLEVYANSLTTPE